MPNIKNDPKMLNYNMVSEIYTLGKYLKRYGKLNNKECEGSQNQISKMEALSDAKEGRLDTLIGEIESSDSPIGPVLR